MGYTIDNAKKAYVQSDLSRTANFDCLKSIAELRVVVELVADIMNDYVKDSPEKKQLSPNGIAISRQLMTMLSKLLERREMEDASLYLAKQIARRHGMRALRQLYDQGYEFVIPHHLQPRSAVSIY